MEWNNLDENYRWKWYALFVETGEEDRVKERLQYKMGYRDHFRLLVPKRKVKERKNGVWNYNVRPLFPGYVLANGSLGVDIYYLLKGTPGLIRILRDKHGPLEIAPKEIYVISHLVRDHELIGISNVFMENGKVIVIEGPLLGMEGLIESVDKRKGRVKVRLKFVGESKLVELSVNILKPA